MIRYRGVEISQKHRTIGYGGKVIQFQHHKSGRRFKLLSMLLLSPRPLTRAELFTKVYWDDPHGGPLTDVNCISVMLVHVARLVVELGLELVVEGPHTMRVYSVKLPPELPPASVPLVIMPSPTHTHIGALSAPIKF